jgi:hypothetical protein
MFFVIYFFLNKWPKAILSLSELFAQKYVWDVIMLSTVFIELRYFSFVERVGYLKPWGNRTIFSGPISQPPVLPTPTGPPWPGGRMACPPPPPHSQSRPGLLACSDSILSQPLQYTAKPSPSAELEYILYTLRPGFINLPESSRNFLQLGVSDRGREMRQNIQEVRGGDSVGVH